LCSEEKISWEGGGTPHKTPKYTHQKEKQKKNHQNCPKERSPQNTNNKSEKLKEKSTSPTLLFA
jgi:hypothetical protein